MGKNCEVILQKNSPEIHQYLQKQVGPYSENTKQAWKDAAIALQNHTLDNLHNIYAGMDVPGYEKLLAKAAQESSTRVEGFKQAGEKARDTKDATHIGRWMLDNSQKGDVVRFQDGGYEVTEVTTKKDGTKELVLTPFEFNEDGTKDYNNTGIKIISEQSIKNGSNLFENAYTNSKGERVVEQSVYEPQNRAQESRTRVEEGSGGVGRDVETKQQIENFGVNKADVEPVHSVISQVFNGLKKAGLTAAKTVGDWVGIGKGTEKPYSLKIDGKDVKVKPTSPEVVNGFYSPLEKVITDSKFDKLPAKQWAEKYANSEEAKWTGLKDWLAQQQGSVSKADIQQFLKDNRIQVVEVVKGAEEKQVKYKQLSDMPNAIYGFAERFIETGDKKFLKEIEKEGYTVHYDNNGEVDYFTKEGKTFVTDQTKFSQYQLEGQKENYREVLVTMPAKIKSVPFWKLAEGERRNSNGDLTAVKINGEWVNKNEAKVKYGIDYDTINNESEYKFKSSHFDEPNILVHLRMNTRVDAEGKKVLFLEEIQSDFGQQGKKEGFIKKEFSVTYRTENGIKDQSFPTREKAQEFVNKVGRENVSSAGIRELTNGKVPEAPFVTDTNAWTKLGLKVALKEAVKQGADKIAWTTGEQQNDRYDLSKQVEYIQYEDGFGGTKYVDISTQNSIITLQVDKDGKVLENKNTQLPDVVGKNLSDVIGKDATEKIMRGDGTKERIEPLVVKDDITGKYDVIINGRSVSSGHETYNDARADYLKNPKYQNTRRLQGDGLKVGGKGMKGFYGSPTEGSLGIVGNVAKSLFKQEPKTTDIITDSGYDADRKNVEWDKVNVNVVKVRSGEREGLYFVELDGGGLFTVIKDHYFEKAKEAEAFGKQHIKEVQDQSKFLSTQHSIDITPELKASVEGGQPLFKKVDAVGKSLTDIHEGKTFYEVVKENDLTDEQSTELAKELAESKTLPKKQFSKKDKIANDFDPNDNIDVKPIDKPIKTGKSKVESIGATVSKDEMRPAMKGVFHDAENGRMVTTDGMKMVIIEDKSIKKTEIIDPKTGNVIDAKFPNYDVVIPKDNPIKRKVNVKEWLSQLNGLAETKKFFDKPIAVRIKIGEQEFAFDSELMRDVFNVMAEQGITDVELQLSQPNRALVVESNKSVIGLVMPFMVGEEYRGGLKTLHQSEMTIAEKNGVVQKEIDALESRRKDINNNLKEAISKFRNATASNAYSLEFDVDYHKKRLSEIDAEIAEQKSLLIDNPIQEKQDLETVKNNIDNGEITSQEATEYAAKPTKRTRKVKQSIEIVESKAESENEAELNEAIKEADGLISGEIEEVKAPVKPKTNQGIQAQYRIESGKNIVEAIKDFNGSPRATVALTHEIMHPTVVSIIDGAKEGNEVGAKHTKTIVDEFNKANPNNKVTAEDLIKGNDAFKEGTTSKQYRAVQEFIAKSWEKYHREGGKGFSESFQKVLEQITEAFKAVYKSISGKELTPELRKMFDEILGKEAVEQSLKEQPKATRVDKTSTVSETGKKVANEIGSKAKNKLAAFKAKHLGERIYGTPDELELDNVYAITEDNVVLKINDKAELDDAINKNSTFYNYQEQQQPGETGEESGSEFQVQEKQTEAVTDMKEIVKELVKEGTTSLKEIQAVVSDELGDNSKKMKDLVEDAYHEYGKSAAKNDTERGISKAVAKRVGQTLSRIFGGEAGDKVEVLKNEKELMKEAESSGDVKFMNDPEGKVLGFTSGGIIYLNGEHLNPNTPVHEAGHIWTEFTKENHPEIYQRGIELLSSDEGNKYMVKAKASEFYQTEAAKLPSKQREAYYQHEALAMAIGDKGAQFVTEATKKGFREWLSNLWTSVKNALGFKNITPDELQNLTFDEFTERAARDILAEGEKPSARPTAAQQDPELTKIANAVNDQLITDKFGTDALDDIISQLQDTGLSKVYDAIKEKIKARLIDPRKIREKVLTYKAGNAADQAVLLYDMADLKGQEDAIMKEIVSTTDQKEIAELQRTLVDIQNEMMQNALANRFIGRDWHNIGIIRQQWINKDFDIVRMRKQYMAAKGITQLTQEQEAEIKAKYDEIALYKAERDKLKSELDVMVQEVERLKAENEFLARIKHEAKVEKQTQRVKMTGDQIQKSQDRIAAAKEELRKMRGDMNDITRVLPKAALLIGKIAAEKVYQGVIEFGTLVKEILDEVKEIFPDWKEENVVDHLLHESGSYKKYYEAGRAYDTSNKELRDKIKAYNKVQKQYALKMFQWQRDRRMDTMAKRPLKERIYDGILRWQRFAVLSYPTTIVKLAAVVLHQIALKPFKFLIQKAIATILPKSITSKQSLWGNPTWRSLAKYYSGFVNNMTLANLREQFGGVDTKEILYGDNMMYDEWAAAKGFLEMPGRSHGWIKSFIKNPEFAFAQENIATHYITKMAEIEQKLKDPDLTAEQKDGLQDEYGKWNITDPDVMERINKMSLEHARWSILMNGNKIVENFRKWANPKGLVGFIARTELPILKIPVNYVSRAFAVKYGFLKALTGSKWMGGNVPSIFELIYKGTDNLTEDQANLLGRTLTLGTMGASFFALGYMMGCRPKENEDGSVDLCGFHINKNLVHSPEIESILAGAHTKNSFDKIRKKDAGVWLEAYIEADLDIAAKNPFINMLKYGFIPNVAGTVTSRESWDKKRKEFVDEVAKKITDMGIPGAVKQTAGALDTKRPGFHLFDKPVNRKPKGDDLERVLQAIELTIPVLRKKVPLGKQYKD